MSTAQTTVADWLQIIRGEFQEIPGLHLTKAQVQRLWALDSVIGDALIDALVDLNFLRRTTAGTYVRADIR